MSRSARHAALVVTGIVLLAAALRVAVASLSPILSFVEADVVLPPAAVGLIGAAPPVSFAVFGLLTPVLARRVRIEALAVAAAGVSAAGLAARAFAGDATALVLTTLVAFAGIGVGNVILPALIKKHFPTAVARLSTVYISTMSIATLLPPVVAVPLAESAGWRLSLGVWAVVGAIAVVPWVALLVGARRADGAASLEGPWGPVLGRILRVPLTWALVAAMLVTSATVYSMFAWMPTLLQEHAGVDAATAGVMLGVFSGMGLPFGLVVPFLVARFAAIRTLFVVAVVPGLVAVAGMLWAPASAPWLWVLLLSMPSMLFPLVLVLVGVRTRGHAATVALSGVVQSTGYGIAALFPIAMGALHEATGGWDGSLWLLAGLYVIGIPAGLVIARAGSVEDGWERRHGPW